MNKKAFTLIEILLALAILGIGLVGILSVFSVGTNAVRKTVTMTEASFFAQMILEDFKRQGHINPDNLSLPDLSTYEGYEKYDFSFPPPALEGSAYRIDLAVKDKKGNEIVKFTTYISKYVP